MNLKDAFAGMKEAKDPTSQNRDMGHPGAQAPKRLSTQEPKTPGAQAAGYLGTQAPKRLGTPAPGKSSHPEFEPVKIYIRSETRKRAWRKWEDARGGDFSDLVEHLLQQYLLGT